MHCRQDLWVHELEGQLALVEGLLRSKERQQGGEAGQTFATQSSGNPRLGRHELVVSSSLTLLKT